MIRLIVNADDLGSGPARDRGIFRAFTEGLATSASLLANGPSCRPAARAALACGLPVGVHLNLSEGRSLTGPIAGLTDGGDSFPGKTALRDILLAATFDAAAVRRELLAQIARVRDAGIEPDHLDTHQHCLLFPALTGLVAEVAEDAGIRALRLPLPAEAGAGSPPPALAAELALYGRLAPAAAATLRAAGLWTPDGLWGMPLLNRLDETTLAATLGSIPAGTWELMTHPGEPDPDDPFGGPQRASELQALTAPAIRDLVAGRGIELTTFGACACAC
ncbi:MAG: ChbG/HpnK family deacetylase [Deltaproteobacteria bacterium]|nr:MAG: ChbG/HpnK family deacetylase [Deltaproteobacteria bacterium]